MGSKDGQVCGPQSKGSGGCWCGGQLGGPKEKNYVKEVGG